MRRKRAGLSQSVVQHQAKSADAYPVTADAGADFFLYDERDATGGACRYGTTDVSANIRAIGQHERGANRIHDGTGQCHGQGRARNIGADVFHGESGKVDGLRGCVQRCRVVVEPRTINRRRLRVAMAVGVVVGRGANKRNHIRKRLLRQFKVCHQLNSAPRTSPLLAHVIISAPSEMA